MSIAREEEIRQQQDEDLSSSSDSSELGVDPVRRFWRERVVRPGKKWFEDQRLMDRINNHPHRRQSRHHDPHPPWKDASKGLYDVAIVLTGLNDVKDAALPSFLTSPDNVKETQTRRDERRDAAAAASSGAKGYEGELNRILAVLKDKMSRGGRLLTNTPHRPPVHPQPSTTTATTTTHRHDDSHHSDHDDDVIDGGRPSRNPRSLIVLPGLPAEVVPAFHWMPLRYFVLPLLRRVDGHKRNLASSHPGSVLFVESPSTAEVAEYESGLGDVYATRSTEDVLFAMNHISRKARAQVERAMDAYYRNKAVTDRDERERERQYDQSYHQHSSAARPIAYSPPGSKLFSIDRIHPNSDGYDFSDDISPRRY